MDFDVSDNNPIMALTAGLLIGPIGLLVGIIWLAWVVMSLPYRLWTRLTN